MNFNDYQKGPTEYPFLEEVASEYLVRPNGKPTLLTYLLKDLGCTIHPSSEAHGLTPVAHDEKILSTIIDKVIEDYIRYHNHHPETHDETTIGDAMRDHTSSFLDPNDFIPGTADLKPISIDDIRRFMHDTILMRVGKSSHFKHNPHIQKLQHRISEISKALAIEVSHNEISRIAKGKDDIMHKIHREVGEKAGFERFTDQMDALRKTVNKNEIKKVDTASPIKDTNVLAQFTTLRALVRTCNREMGIDTQNEQKRLDEARAEDGKKQPKWQAAA